VHEMGCQAAGKSWASLVQHLACAGELHVPA
jgi:hypothetical protein